MGEAEFETVAEPESEDPLRDQLLDAAARVFAEKSYLGTKIMDVVKAAGLSSGAIYGRFDSKEELLMEAVLRQVERNALENRFGDMTVAEILVDGCRASGALTDTEAIELEAVTAARREPQIAEAITEARKRWRATLVDDLINRAIAEGSVSEDADFESIVYFMESMRLGLFVQRGAGQEAPDEAAWLLFIERVIRGLAAPAATAEI